MNMFSGKPGKYHIRTDQGLVSELGGRNMSYDVQLTGQFKPVVIAAIPDSGYLNFKCIRFWLTTRFFINNDVFGSDNEFATAGTILRQNYISNLRIDLR